LHVIATAGHVDHGKSTLVRALTGMEPDRWSEEKRRGMTIDLGFAWTTLPSGSQIAFVDVPGHERFTTNMLAGVGPVPAALLVVAADGGWSAQTTEHVTALDALGVRHGVLAVTRSDLADPAPVVADGLDRLASTSLGRVEAVAVAAPTGDGLDLLRAVLGRLVASLPAPVTEGRVRLWVDRAFTMRGFGTVLTGTLGSGQVAVGDKLDLGGEEVVVRGLESLGTAVASRPAVARVALNLRAVPRAQVRRGQALLTPDAWHLTDAVDVRLHAPADGHPRELVLHIGSAAVPVRVRSLDDTHLRLGLATPLPLQIGDRALLRDPGQRRILSGLVVLDPAPPSLARRGAARARAGVLAQMGTSPDLAGEVARRQVVSRALLARLGVADGPPPKPPAGSSPRLRGLVGATPSSGSSTPRTSARNGSCTTASGGPRRSPPSACRIPPSYDPSSPGSKPSNWRTAGCATAAADVSSTPSWLRHSGPCSTVCPRRRSTPRMPRRSGRPACSPRVWRRRPPPVRSCCSPAGWCSLRMLLRPPSGSSASWSSPSPPRRRARPSRPPGGSWCPSSSTSTAGAPPVASTTTTVS
jgi:selenocysteine-specific translation elongation factor